MLTRRYFHVLSMALQIAVAVGAVGVAGARAQGRGGAGTVQGTVKDPTGGVMQAVEVKIGNTVSGFDTGMLLSGSHAVIDTNAVHDSKTGMMDKTLAQRFSVYIEHHHHKKEQGHHGKKARKSQTISKQVDARPEDRMHLVNLPRENKG